MEQLLIALLLYVVVFGADYLFYVKLKNTYNYVSRRTFMLLFFAQVFTFWYFYPVFEPFIEHLLTEIVMLGIILIVVFLFTYALVRDQLYICSMSSRTLRCLTPFYVFVKGAEIVFQELIYLVIALSLTSLLGIHFITYVVFVTIVLLVHVLVILGGGQAVVKSLTFGLAAISIPIFYVFTELGYFWPAVYLHGLMYVFYWLLIADFDVEPGENSEIVHNSGKLSG